VLPVGALVKDSKKRDLGQAFGEASTVRRGNGGLLRRSSPWPAVLFFVDVFLVNFDLTSEICRWMGAAPLPRGDIMRYQ
jgi:preprotein translocase subunit SecG